MGDGKETADNEGWERAVWREPKAFERLFERHANAIFAFCVRRTGDRSAAEDLMSTTFLHAWRRRADMQPGTDGPLPWLYGIATNLLHRHRRVERRQLDAYARSGVNNWVAYEDDAAARIGDSSHGAQLARALAAMPPPERDALLLYALADLSYDEIACALDVPVGTVGTWLHRARLTAQHELATETNALPLATTGADRNE